MCPRVIQANYDMLDRIAKYFDQSEQAVANLRNSVAHYAQRVQTGGWTGVGAGQFLAEMDDSILPALSRLQNVMCLSQQTVSRLIQIFTEAEEDAAKLFEGNGNGAGMFNKPLRYPDPGDGFSPPPATDEQIKKLKALGIVLAKGEQISEAEAQYLIDYANGHKNLIAADDKNSPWTAKQLREAIDILKNMQQLHVNFGQSPYVAGTWTLAQLQQIGGPNGVINMMAA